jgi:hypothetical protein
MLIKPCVSGLAIFASLVLAACTEPATPGSNTTSDTPNGAFRRQSPGW